MRSRLPIAYDSWLNDHDPTRFNCAQLAAKLLATATPRISPAGGELLHEARVDRRLRFEVEVLEQLHGREVGNLALLQATSLVSSESRELAGGRQQHVVESLGDILKPQLPQALLHARMAAAPRSSTEA